MGKQDVTVELFYDGVWNEAPVYVRDPITITVGRGDESSELMPKTATLVLDNRSGDYNPRNPSSALYGKIGRNTVLRVRVDGSTRFYGEVSSWKPGRTVDFDPATGRGDAWTEVEAAGPLRRLGQGADALDSPLRRRVLDWDPTAYWPLEDLDGAAGANSPVDGVEPMVVFNYSRFTAPGTGTPVAAAGLPKFGTGTGIPGSAPVVDLAQGGVLQGHVPTATGAGDSWTLSWVMVAPRDKADTVIPIEWRTDGTYSQWQFQIESTGIFGTFGDAVTGISSGSISHTFNVFDGLPHVYTLDAGMSTPTEPYIDLYIDGGYVTSYTPFSFPWVASPGNITQVIINPLEIREDEAAHDAMPVVGHVAAWNPARSSPPPDFSEAMSGYVGETAGERFDRLCLDEGLDPFPLNAARQRVGVQHIARFVDLLSEIERTDGGLIYESAESTLIFLKGINVLYNQTAALTLDYAADEVAPPLEPVVDDQGTRNDVTATSTTSGGAARAVLEAGAMSVEAPPDGVGRYATQVDVNPQLDADLPNYSGWYLHRGTVEAVRLPRVTVDLVASPGLAAAAAAVNIGDRIDIDNLPPYIAADDPALIVLGYTETIGSHTRRITFNTVPAALYRVAEADDEPRVAADGSTLAADLAATDTPNLNSNPYFEVDASGWFTNSGEGSIARSTAQSHEGVASLLLTPGGVGGSAAARSIAATGISPGQVLYGQAWLRCAVARTVGLRIDWRDGAGVFLSSTSLDLAVAANTWTYFGLLATAPASTAQAGITARMGSTPPGSHLLWIDEAWLHTALTAQLASTAANGPWTTATADFPLDIRVGGERMSLAAISGSTSPQTATISARGVNGVLRAWGSGTEVDVWEPAIAAL